MVNRSNSAAVSGGDRSSRSVVVVAAVLDVLFLVVFVLIGRASHGEGVLGTLVTLWPFLVGVIVGWVLARAWRMPRRIVWTGVVIWLSVVVVGMLLRVLSQQGIEPSFVVVATIAVGVFLLGWRALSSLVIRVIRGS